MPDIIENIDTSSMTPVEIDTVLARIWTDEARTKNYLESTLNGIDNDAKRGYTYGLERAEARAAQYREELAALTAEASPFENEFELRRWNRYFLVQNTGGHVHRERNCVTCFPTTQYGWIFDLSGCDEAVMVVEYGELACTVCFPDAPTNPGFNGPGRRNQDAKAERDAAKAERDAKKAAKTLEPDHRFRDLRNDRVETVAAAKTCLRDIVELRLLAELSLHNPTYYQGLIVNSDEVEQAARTALAAKGVTDAEMATIMERADKRTRKDYGLPS